ncbi:MYG1 family protein [Octadecabacter sp. 1_MG-2023]|uniref:MYG1 family protein n=1 Tax=unclassified Octadecabacter TaxID=196158 RepID=UPI001C0A4022|nr:MULTISPECIES: MYG1 family protein [unclassified Octadecabacter]MBU2994757.1 MYG1 family protein [Octadecabacter sp. B2R22]MDO6733949.1 MYG1 family protein [Octadecabacter sp. 1_MG-2023]
MTITHLVTHSGGFHADELLSSVILTRLFPEAQLMRTRDKQTITPGADKIIYDVGGAYDADAQIFDHHQKPGPLREDEQPYSSFGLVWNHFGRAYLAAMDVPEDHIEYIHGKFDAKFVLPIDLLDNGAMEPSVAGPLSILTLPSLLGSLKPVFDDPSPTADDDAFMSALPIARRFVEAQILNLAAKKRAESLVEDAVDQAGTSPILELPMGMPYRSVLDKKEADHILFVVIPRGDDWTLGGIKLSGDTFEQRADLPAAWAGLTDAALEAASGVKGAKFCHNARFIAVATSRDAILEMAELAVQEAQQAEA